MLWGKANGARRVVRGGSWNNNEDNVRAAYRNRNNTDNRNDNQGFRVALSPQLSPILAGNAVRLLLTPEWAAAEVRELAWLSPVRSRCAPGK